MCFTFEKAAESGEKSDIIFQRAVRGEKSERFAMLTRCVLRKMAIVAHEGVLRTSFKGFIERLNGFFKTSGIIQANPLEKGRRRIIRRILWEALLILN